MQYRTLSDQDEEKTRLYIGAALPNGADCDSPTRGTNVLQKAADGISSAGRRIKKSGGELSAPLTSFDSHDGACFGSGDVEKGENGSSPQEEDPYFVFRDDLLRRVAMAEEALSSYITLVRTTVSTC